MFLLRYWRLLSRLIGGAVLLFNGIAATISDYEVRGWSLSEGLPHEWVRCFQQTDDGYLWVATRGGLARFDGTTIKAFTVANTPSAFKINDNCLSLAKDKVDGSLWIGTREGVVQLKNGRFRRYTWPFHSWIDVWSLSPAKGGGVWAGHSHGLARISAGQPIKRHHSPTYSPQHEFARYISSVLEDKQGRLFLANEDGIQQLNETNLTWHPITEASKGNHRLANNLIEARDGSIYWTTQTGLGRLVTNAVIFYPHSPDMIEPYGLAEDHDGAIWVGGQSGLHRFKDGNFSTVRPDKFGPSESEPTGSGGVEGVMVDRERNLWVGKRNMDGFFQVQRQRYTSYSTADGLLHEKLIAVLPASDGGLWVTTHGGVNKWDGEQFRAVASSAEMRARFSRSVVRPTDLPEQSYSPP